MSDIGDIEYAQKRIGLPISKTHTFSTEQAKLDGLPTFWIAPHNMTGKHIVIVRFESNHYLAKTTGKPFDRPVPFNKSGRV